MNEFYLHCPQYFFLNRLNRISVAGTENNRVAYFSENVKVSLLDSTVYKGRIKLRDKNLIFFPAPWVNKSSYVLYAPVAVHARISIPDEWKNATRVNIEEVTESGLIHKKNIIVRNKQFTINMEGNKPLLLNRID